MPLQGFEPLTLWLLTNHGTNDAKQPLDWDTLVSFPSVYGAQCENELGIF